MKIKPNCTVYGLGFAALDITDDEIVVRFLCDCCGEEHSFPINPESAPLYRMLANRLDEISGKRPRRH